MSENHYNVKAVCRLTGLNEHTLRAWERRYGAIAPSRQDNRRRLYSREDVERLRWLVGLVDQGYAIGQIAGLGDRELRELVAQHELLARKAAETAGAQARPSHGAESAARLLAALRRLDLATLQVELEQARVLYGARELVMGIILPLMGEVGRLVIAQELDIAQEHAMSALVRAQLLDIFFQLRRVREQPRPGARQPVMVVTTPEGDLHEIGILVASILCADAGMSVAYIGPNMPPEPLGRVASVLQADAVLLGLSLLPPGTTPRSSADYVRLLARLLPKTCEIWLGGHVPAEAELGGVPRARRCFKSMIELQQELDRGVTGLAADETS